MGRVLPLAVQVSLSVRCGSGRRASARGYCVTRSIDPRRLSAWPVRAARRPLVGVGYGDGDGSARPAHATVRAATAGVISPVSPPRVPTAGHCQYPDHERPHDGDRPASRASRAVPVRHHLLVHDVGGILP